MKTPETPPAVDRLLRVPEAATLLAISERAAWALLERDVLPVVHIGRATRVRLSDVARLVAEGLPR